MDGIRADAAAAWPWLLGQETGRERMKKTTRALNLKRLCGGALGGCSELQVLAVSLEGRRGGTICVGSAPECVDAQPAFRGPMMVSALKTSPLMLAGSLVFLTKAV